MLEISKLKVTCWIIISVYVFIACMFYAYQSFKTIYVLSELYQNDKGMFD